MGTSTRYKGPSRNHLLPNDFNNPASPDSKGNETPQEESENNSDGQEDGNSNDNADSQQNSNNVDPKWTAAKRNMSKYASGSSRNYKRALSSYVKAYGGARNAAKSASGGVRSTVSFGHFLNSTYTQGIRETLSSYKIDYEGRSAKDILADVINKIAPIPITKEDSVARKALIRTMETLYEKIEDENKDISTLEKIDNTLLNEMIPIQIESYIYERIINDLGSRIEENSSSPSDAINKENELKEYIHSKVDTILQNKNFTQIILNENASRDVENLYQQCYKVMEDML